MSGSPHLSDMPRIALLQIARTGGTTLHELLVEACVPGEMLDSYPAARVDALGHYLPEDIAEFWSGLTSTQRRQCRLLAGHIPFGFDEGCQDRFDYACILRDPVERFISGFLYGTPGLERMHPDQLMFGMHRSVSIAGSPGFDNSLTRVLAGSESANADGDGTSVLKALSQRELDSAIRRLTTRFAFVGLTERFDDSCRLLFRVMGKAFKPDGLRLNATLPRLSVDTLPLSTLRLVERHHAFDLAVYDAGRRIFNEHAGKAGLPEQPPLGRRTSDVGALTSGDHAHTVSGDAAFGNEPDGVWLSARPSTVSAQFIGYLYPVPVRCRTVTVQLANHLGEGLVLFRVEASRDAFARDAIYVGRIAVPADATCHRLPLPDTGPEACAWRIVHDSTVDSSLLAVAYLSFSQTATAAHRDMDCVLKRLEATERIYRVDRYGQFDVPVDGEPALRDRRSHRDMIRSAGESRG